MRDVSVLVARVVFVFEPFLELAVLTDLHGCDPVSFFYQRFTEVLVGIENLACLDAVIKQVPDYLMIHRRSHHKASVFG